MAAVLALVMWTSNATGLQGRTVAQTEQVGAAAQGDYGDVQEPLAPPTSEEAASVEEPAADAPEGQAAPAPSGPQVTLVGKSVPKMGEVVQDGDGRTLYRFDKDTPDPAKSNCEGQCAVTWPPVLSNGTPQLQGVDPALVSTVKRADGTDQVTLDGWPLYTYAKDEAPGQWKGQGVGGTWFVVQPNGKRNVECLPPGVTPPAA
ncbi:lipoprotein [Saccharothrix sp. NRRL B-16348]|nr:lipoprotein [Saccharothrix sp. NRRL B-16348]